MIVNLDKSAMAPKWHEYQGARFRIRPYPRSKGVFTLKDGGWQLSGREQLEKFKYCFMSWEGVEVDGKPVPLTDEVKELIFDSPAPENAALVAFVIQRIDGAEREYTDEQKN